MKSLYKP